MLMVPVPLKAIEGVEVNAAPDPVMVTVLVLIIKFPPDSVMVLKVTAKPAVLKL